MNKKISFEFIIGLIILIITLLTFFYFSLKIDYFNNSKKLILNSNFFDIGDLTVGADVKTMGVKIGEVTEISLDRNSYMAIVKSSLDYDLKIPLDSEFKIANNGFIGSPYIEVTMGFNEQYYKNDDLTENNVQNLLLSSQYEGVGTLEFLYQDNQIYFIEMNTRLQVEHPVTEEAYDLDLVKNQIMVAAGYKIEINDLNKKFHTIECRINAENAKDFSPSPGTIKFINLPGGRGVRVDTAIYTNYRVNPHYDSLILKLISRGENRDEAISIMHRALNEIIIEGINTNIDLHKWILKQDIFTSGQYNTNWLEKNISNFH